MTVIERVRRTAVSLCTASGSRPEADDLYEDILECRPPQFDCRRRNGVDQIAHDPGDIGALRQTDLVALVNRLDPLDPWDAPQRLDIGRGIERLEPDGARVVALPDVCKRVVEHLFAPVDHDQVIADLLGMHHDVGGEDDRCSLPVLLGDEIAQWTHVDGVEAAERLIENEELGLVNHGGDELQLLLHALR